MVELGEGLTKLRRVGFVSGPLHDFEQEASAVLEFIYNTQLEHAACESLYLNFSMCLCLTLTSCHYLLKFTVFGSTLCAIILPVFIK